MKLVYYFGVKYVMYFVYDIWLILFVFYCYMNIWIVKFLLFYILIKNFMDCLVKIRKFVKVINKEYLIECNEFDDILWKIKEWNIINLVSGVN